MYLCFSQFRQFHSIPCVYVVGLQALGKHKLVKELPTVADTPPVTLLRTRLWLCFERERLERRHVEHSGR